MSEFYSPNKNQTGAALFCSFNSKEGAVYFKLIQQTSWNDETKKGGFQGGAVINVKLSQDEAGAIIESVRAKNKTKFYHSFGDASCTGSFSYYSIPPKAPNQDPKQGFGLSVTKGDVTLKVGFSLGAAERLMEFLRFAFDHIFSAEYSAAKKRNEEFQKNKATAPAPKQKPPEPEAEPDESEDGGNPFENDDESAF